MTPSDGWRFWLGQILMIVSTVLGVYLAAVVGFEKAVQFDALTSKRDVYYMLQALQDEMQDNMATMDILVSKVDKLHVPTLVEYYKPQTYIWETMKRSPNTFSIPSSIITGVRRYHADVAVQTRDLLKANITRGQFKQRISDLNKKLRKHVLNRITLEMDNIRTELSVVNMPI